MSSYVIVPPRVTAAPIAGSDDLFPVRRVYCVGRNYADHALEMGVDPRAEPPFFFCKPADTVACTASGPVEILYPDATTNLHHEVELVVAIGKAGRNIKPEDAASHIWGHAVGIDMTRRDLQQAMRKGGKPWEIGKTFERCAPISPIVPIGNTGELTRGRLSLSVNGQGRQSSDLSKLIWSTREIIATLSRYFTLEPGDLIFTGTPEGVGAVEAGDMLSATIDGLGELTVRILPAHEEVAA